MDEGWKLVSVCACIHYLMKEFNKSKCVNKSVTFVKDIMNC